MRKRIPLGIALFGTLAACGVQSPGPPPTSEEGALSGTSWQFVEFRSSDDQIGTVAPPDPENYTMALGADGQASLQVGCNRASGPWSAESSGGESGTFTFGTMAMTRAYCPPPSMDEQIARDTEFIRTFVLQVDRLYLDLMADGGQYVWERM
ncbi:MAG: META domain-containing protein [Gemmatimonas sp.]|nr:META domain-containing protein [Gemmatimonas sp.]